MWHILRASIVNSKTGMLEYHSKGSLHGWAGFFLAPNWPLGSTTHGSKHDRSVYSWAIKARWKIVPQHIQRGFESLFLFSIIIHQLGAGDFPLGVGVTKTSRGVRSKIIGYDLHPFTTNHRCDWLPCCHFIPHPHLIWTHLPSVPPESNSPALVVNEQDATAPPSLPRADSV